MTTITLCSHCRLPMAPTGDPDHTIHPCCSLPELQPAWAGIVTVGLAAIADQLRLPPDAPAGRVAYSLKNADHPAPDRNLYDDIRRYRMFEAGLLQPPEPAPVASVAVARAPAGPPVVRPRRDPPELIPRAMAVASIATSIADPAVAILVAPSGLAGVVARWLSGLEWQVWIADGTEGKPHEQIQCTRDPQIVVAADVLEQAVAGSRWTGVWGVFVMAKTQPVRQRLGQHAKWLVHPVHRRMALLCDDPNDPPGWPRLVLEALAVV